MQFEQEKKRILREEKDLLEREYSRKQEEFEVLKNQENKDKIELLINKFSEEVLEKDKLIETLTKKCNSLDLIIDKLERKVKDSNNSREVDILKNEVNQLREDLSYSREKNIQFDLHNSNLVRENQSLNEQIGKLRVQMSSLHAEKNGIVYFIILIIEMEKNKNKEYEENKTLQQTINKLKDNKEIDILNERNRMQILYERKLKEQDNKYKNQLKMIESKIMTLLDTKAKDISDLKEQIEVKNRLVNKYEELLEKQRKDFLIKN